MKKGISIAFLVFLGAMQTQAQVTFKPGIRTGANFAHFTENSYDYYSGNNVGNIDNFSSVTRFYAGFYGELKVAKHYALQPEIDYSGQGSNFKFRDSQTGITTTNELTVSYLSMAVVNKFIFDKFNFHVGPTMDFTINKNFYTENGVDLAFILGAGYNFTSNFGIEARVKKGIVPVFYDYNDYDGYGRDHTNVVFSVGGTYTFDVK